MKGSYNDYARNRERMQTNNKLVKSIVGIFNRKSQYVDILAHTSKGQPVYNLISHSRGIALNQPDQQVKHVSMNERSGVMA